MQAHLTCQLISMSFKRAFDIVGACAGLLVFTPVMAIAFVAVLLDDGRPVIFRQARLGYRRRPFPSVRSARCVMGA